MAEPRTTEPGPPSGYQSPVAGAPDAAVFWRWVGQSIRPYAGWVLVGIGAVVIFFGYLGVSREALVAKQLPYLISGGIFGLALVALGTFFLATEELRHDSRRLDRIERMVFELHAVLLERPDAPPAEEIHRTVATLAGVAPNSNGNLAEPHIAQPHIPQPHIAEPQIAEPQIAEPQIAVLALPEGHRYHRSGCPMVEGKPLAAEVSSVAIRRRGLQPCSMCEPIVQGA